MLDAAGRVCSSLGVGDEPRWRCVGNAAVVFYFVKKKGVACVCFVFALEHGHVVTALHACFLCSGLLCFSRSSILFYFILFYFILFLFCFAVSLSLFFSLSVSVSG